jgi:hypothetical protein
MLRGLQWAMAAGLVALSLAYAESSFAQSSSEKPVATPLKETSTSTDDEVIAYINKLVRQGWSDNGVRPAQPATDSEWARRIYLDIMGRIPTVEETNAFLTDRSRDKKAKLLDKLLFSDEYVEQYARNWTTIWTNTLIGRTGGTERRTMVSRDGLQQYLRRTFLRNKPYDEFVFELISANGTNKPGEEGYNGAVNFLLDNLAENAVPATAKTARIFLGLQVQCTQCHNHPFNDWKQDAFWSMNAFFRQTKPTQLSRRGDDMQTVRLDDTDFAGEDNDPREAAIFYELRNGLSKVAYPTFIDGQSINKSGYVQEVNRRDELARLVRQSPNLGQAMVNRTWAHFFGYGFTKPIDDMGPHNPPTHPELLERLSKDFSSRGYDVKTLIRWITLSEAYSLSSRFNPANRDKDVKDKFKDDPSMGDKPLFSHFYLRQMQAEQLYESLVVATEADKGRGSYEEQERVKNEWLRQFNTAFGTDEGDEATTFNGTIPQALMMMNGDLIKRATDGAKGSYLYNLAHSSAKDADKISLLYLAALSRKPTTQELKMAQEYWVLRKGNTVEALQDIFWALLNSNEFIINH